VHVVAAEQERAIRRYRRLWISRNDLHEAAAAVDLIDRSALHRDKSGNHPTDLIILTTALVVSYARPFIDTRGKSDVADRVVPGSILRVLTKKQRELHNLIIYMRQKEVAHSDAEVLDLSIRVFPNGDSAISRSARDPLYRRELTILRSIIRKLNAEIEQQSSTLRLALPHHIWL
jgi:hypothetical protein